MDILVLKKAHNVIEFIYYLGSECRETTRYFNHIIEIPLELEVLDDSLFRIALFGRPENANFYNIIGLKVPLTTKSFLEKQLGVEISVEISTKDEEINMMKFTPEEFYLAFSGGFDSIASKAILGERVKLFSIDFGGSFERETNFFKKFDTTIIKWKLRGNREDSSIRFNEGTDWRFMLAAGLIFRKENRPVLISTGTIMEASSEWFTGDVRPDFQQYNDACLDPFGPNVGTMNPLACITEYGTTLIANKSLSQADLDASLNSLAAPNSFKRFRKEVLLSIVSGNTLPDKPTSVKKHTFGKSITDDLLGMYLVWKVGKEWTLENYLDVIPDDIFNVDMGFVEKVNYRNLETIDLEMREHITQKLKEYGLLYYSDADFRNLNLAKNFLVNKEPIKSPSNSFSFLKKFFSA